MDLSQEIPIGINTTTLIPMLPLWFRDVDTFYFIKYKPSLGAPERLKKKRPEKSPLNAPTSLHDFFGRTRWHFERTLIHRINKNPYDAALIVSELIRHNFNESDGLLPVKKEELNDWLKNAVSMLQENEALGIVSKCTSGGILKQIPLMDFSCAISSPNELFLKNAMQGMGCTEGLFLDSGRSYHFYGLNLFSQAEWLTFMSQCLLISPYSDVRYIAHRILSGHSILRITGSLLKPQIPQVINYFRMPKP